MKTRIYALAALITAVALAAGAPAPAGSGKQAAEGGKGPITVASKIDTEGALLGNMIILMLEQEGFQVVDRTEFGPTDVIRKAITSGEIDLYPEYTGNGGFFYAETDSSLWKDPDKGYRKVKELDKKNHDVVWLTPAPANNTWALAVRNDLVGEHGVRTLEDFARYVNGGGRVKVAGSEEFVNRPDALPAFEQAYGFELNKDQLLILSGGNTAQTEKAAADGTDGVNVAMAYGTDGQLAALGLWVLEDTRGVQPYYQPTPILRGEVYREHPEIEDILDPVFRSLDLVTLQSLNAAIAVEGQAPRSVAQRFLRDKGFLED